MAVLIRRALALAVLGMVGALPAGCADDVYGSGGISWSSYPVYGWYDDYYGPFHDGYWGSDGFFWFRLTPHDNRYRRDERRHFRRDNPPGQHSYRRFDRTIQPPAPGTRMPRFPGEGRRRDSRGRY